MNKAKIFELKIEEDDELSGIDSISLVDEPAIEINWVAFKKEKEHEFHIPDGEDEIYIQKLISIAQDEQELFDEGWIVDKVTIVGQNEFVSTNPNGSSIEDEKQYNVRYKYILNPRISGQSAVIPTTRDFCKSLISKNYVWRVEDMEATQNDFGDSAMVWRGGFNCRHVWSRILYKKDAKIINKASVNKGKVDIGGFPNDLVPDTRVLGYNEPSTVTQKTLNNPSPSTIRNLGLSKEKMEIVPPNVNVYGVHTLYFQMCPGAQATFEHLISMDNDDDTKGMIRSAAQIADNVFRIEYEVIKAESATQHQYEEAVILVDDFKDLMSEIDKISGMKHDVSYMDGHIEKIKKYLKEDFESYSDYPDSVKNNAQAVLKYVEENGWGDCGTDVGKQRANQLAKGEPISEDTIQRMYSYLSRHKVDLDSSTGYDDGCGKLMYDSWGGLSALSWAESKVNSFGKQNFAKISLDYDGTLSKLEGRLLAKRLVEQGNDVYVVTARQDSNSFDVYRTAKEVGIPRNNVYFTNGRPKSPKLKSLGIKKHYDNNPDVIKEIRDNAIGVEAIKFDYENSLPSYVDEVPTGKTKNFMEQFEYLFTQQTNNKQHFQADAEKKIVLGPAMIPDMKIFRKDKKGDPYYVFFSAETIKMIAEKYMKNKYLDNNDMMHDGQAVPDVYVTESWIKEDDNDKSVKYGYGDLPIGTWFVAMKVKNDAIWAKVKDHQLNGFSVSGFFEEVAAFHREEAFLKELAEILKKIK